MAIALRALYPQPLVGQPDVAPAGWSFNPSTWGYRIVMVFAALLCSFFAHYMAAFQLGLIPSIWDPFFGDGTYKVVTSTISKDFPVSDAGLGALAYALEALMGCQGDNQRWRTRPWAAIGFGILVVPVSLVSILLIISQPVIVGAWCGWCLLIAFIMILMLPLAVAEFAASLHFLHQSYLKGKPLWHIFWYGDESSSKVFSTDFKNTKSLFPPAGVTISWNLVVTALLGVWMVVSDHLVQLPSSISNSNYIAGLLVYTFSILAMAELTRPARYINVLFGLWLAIVPWLASDVSTFTLLNQTLTGTAILLFSLRLGPIRSRYGTLSRFII